jgi:hypothetical protein
VLGSALAQIRPPAPVAATHRAALVELRQASQGFRDMSRAARARSSGRWLRARGRVRLAEGRFQAALRSLGRRGYDVA